MIGKPVNNYGSDDDSHDHVKNWEALPEKEQNMGIQNPGHVDEAIWKKAKKAAEKSGHPEKWPLVMYLYEKMGGK